MSSRSASNSSRHPSSELQEIEIEDAQLPAPLTRNDYAAYASLMRNLEQRERPLANKLLSLQSVRDRVDGRHDDAVDEEGEEELSSGLSSGLEEEYLPSEDDQDDRIRYHLRPPKRARGQSDNEARSAKKEKVDNRKLDDRWPLTAAALGTLETSLDDSILDIAYTQIRRGNLQLPGIPISKGRRHLRGAGGSAAKVDASMQRRADEIVISSTLVQETKTYLNRVLIELAGLRPMDFGNRRSKMGPMSWQGVLDAAAILHDSELVKETSGMIRKALFPQHTEDLLVETRLQALEKYKQAPLSLDPLFGPVLAIAPPKKSHLSEAELEARAAKRAAKLLDKQAKDEINADKVRLREERRLATKQRVSARNKRVYQKRKAESGASARATAPAAPTAGNAPALTG